ncbi:hypothetical protein ACFFWD_42530 [Bradyrhizobium erythrophlei]|uniref:hypothetical protein n=1 Tax=Bradyrhizobium erythrophlei TaxID=1437360 RepID=UPI0035E6DE96
MAKQKRGKGREATINVASSREAKGAGRKHLTREEREAAAHVAFNLAKKSDSLGEAAAAVAKMFGVSFTTAQSWIRRGRHLANQPRKSRATTRR